MMFESATVLLKLSGKIQVHKQLHI